MCNFAHSCFLYVHSVCIYRKAMSNCISDSHLWQRSMHRLNAFSYFEALSNRKFVTFEGMCLQPDLGRGMGCINVWRPGNNEKNVAVYRSCIETAGSKQISKLSLCCSPSMLLFYSQQQGYSHILKFAAVPQTPITQYRSQGSLHGVVSFRACLESSCNNFVNFIKFTQNQGS